MKRDEIVDALQNGSKESIDKRIKSKENKDLFLKCLFI